MAHEEANRKTQKDTKIYTKESRTDAMMEKKKDWAGYITATTENNSFCPPFWCSTIKAHTHTRCFFSHSSSSSPTSSRFFFVIYSLLFLYSPSLSSGIELRTFSLKKQKRTRRRRRRRTATTYRQKVTRL